MPDQTAALLDFIAKSPTPFHAVAECLRQLEGAGYARLHENDAWELAVGGKYMVTRNDSSLIAFTLNAPPEKCGMRFVGAHGDSPCLRVKPNAIDVAHGVARLATEVYGGALLHPWFDRDLSLAGRVIARTDAGQLISRLVDFAEPLAFIPSLAIHLDREVNAGRGVNKQLHLPALLCTGDAPDFAELLRAQITKQHGEQNIAQVSAFELSLYDCQPPALVGLRREFIAAARLDNLLSCFAAMRALIEGGGKHNGVLVINDHEEVGSESTAGAAGTFLLSVMERICGDAESLRRALSRSMMISADNAHAVHPNYPDKHEPNHRPQLNAGIVIKTNHNQSYASNAETEALFKQVCARAKLDVQTFVTRGDLACGGTIGPITANRLGLRTLDIGAPQLGMHSIRELAGVKDQATLAAALRGFYECDAWPF